MELLLEMLNVATDIVQYIPERDALKEEVTTFVAKCRRFEDRLKLQGNTERYVANEIAGAMLQTALGKTDGR